MDFPNPELLMIVFSQFVCRAISCVATTQAGVDVAVLRSAHGGVLNDFEHSAASIGESVLLLTCLDGIPTGIHGRAAWSSRSGTHRDGSTNHCGARDRVIVTVPATTAAFHVDVLIDVDVVTAAAADIAGTGISPAVAGLSATATTAAGTAATRTSAAATPTATTATRTSATATTTATATAATTTPRISVRSHGEAGHNRGGHRGRKPFSE
jgi:hypothetical protein